MTPRRGPALAVVAAVLVAVLTGCGAGPNLLPRTTTGAHGRMTVVLTDPVSQPAMAAAIQEYVDAKESRVVSATGTPPQVATSVKDGAVVDLVVLPPGRDLDRVRDELVTPPVPLGDVRGIRYWLAPVTYRGLVLARFLDTSRARAVLRTYGVG